MKMNYSAACERNKDSILEVLKGLIDDKERKLLEIGSGTGQHAVYLAPYFANLTWVTSDLECNHANIIERIKQRNTSNVRGPVPLEIGNNEFPEGNFDIIFTANTFHIMSWQECMLFIKNCGNLSKGALVIIYGPFNYNGKYTSESNQNFDKFLKSNAAHKSIRNFEDVRDSMKRNGVELENDYEMPANNRILVFKKI